MSPRARRGAVIAIALGLLGTNAFLASRLHLKGDVAAILPAGDPIVRDYRFVMERFQTLDKVYIDIGVASEGLRDDAIAAAEDLHGRLVSSDRFERIYYRSSPGQLMQLLDAVRAAMPRLLDDADLAVIDGRAAPKEVESRLKAAWRQLLEPGGTFSREQVRLDPLAFSDLLVDKLERMRGERGGAQIIDGRIWSGGGTHLLMIAAPGFPATDTERAEPLVTFLNEARDAALAACGAPEVTISYTGGHISVLDNTNTIKNDVRRSVTAISIGIALLGVLVFRRWVHVALVFLPAAFGLSCAAALFGVMNPAVSGISLGCGAALIGITVDYGVHVLHRLDAGGKDGLTPARCVATLRLPLLVGAATTGAAFLSLLCSSLPGQREMGVFAALGVAGSLAFTLFFLPAFTPGAKTSRRAIVPLDEWCAKLLAWREGHRTLIALLGCAVFAAGILGLGRLEFEGDVRKMSSLTGRNRVDESTILSVWGGFAPTFAVVRGESLEEALQANDALHDEVKDLVAEGAVTSAASIAPLLPSVKTQEANLAQWRGFWTEERRTDLKRRIGEAAARLGFDDSAFLPFFDSLGAGDSPVITLDTLTGTGYDELLANHVSTDGEEALVMTSLRLADRGDFDAVAARLKEAVPGAVLMDKQRFVEHTSALMLRDLLRLASVAAAAVLLCLVLTLGAIELVVAAFLPVCVSAVTALGLLGLFGIRINMISALFIIFVFGVGVDFSVFLLSSALERFRGNPGYEAGTVGSVAICALTTMCGFAGLMLARNPGFFSIGVTGLVGIGAGLFTSVALVPEMTRVLLPLQPRHIKATGKTMVGLLIAASYLAAHCVAYLLVGKAYALIRWRGEKFEQQRFARRWLHAIAMGFVRYFPFPDNEIIYKAPDSGFGEGAGVIVSNHQSSFDSMVVLGVTDEMVMVVKKWVWHAPGMGRMLKDAGYILAEGVDYETVFEQCRVRLEEGVSVLFFPEGTRRDDGRIRRFHKGAFELAVRTYSDVIPVLLTDTRSCLAKGVHYIGSHRCVVRTLPRVTPETFDYSRDARELGRHVRGLLLERVDEDWRLSQTGPGFWTNLRWQYKYLGSFVEPYVKWKTRLDPIYARIDEIVPQEGHVLDLGCGYGIMSNILAYKSLHRTVLGLDSDADKIRIARCSARTRERIRFETADVMTAELEKADGALLIDVLHYWTREKQLELLARVCGALRPGGVLVFREVFQGPARTYGITALGEVFTTTFGINRRHEGLHFGDRDFYVEAVTSHGMTLQGEHPEMARGANGVLVFRKEGA